ncbi:uncharacterized protein MONBRDRAFT_32729 [Monosiga brevicollis MX1]|uniref:PDZ domain-containing protein n=1 Tax=Monosiga brevicollis TaxID=81824 RepID=A9V1C6_MONBE|nr:uncharacterized protein MONBRDRAFT_32729 [Monosiga brevicollis MX1]EDQ88543.1 predicted protein [Monosiga brevicollis MX1]|eukprot:XP_001746647.1 hypothetical protein [Monosiga brevicollis MX1]
MADQRHDGSKIIADQANNHCRNVELTKPAVGGFGFNVTGGHPAALVVSKITPQSPAEGELAIGDQILSINGHSTAGMTQVKFVTMVKASRPTLQLEVRKSTSHRTNFAAAPRTPETQRRSTATSTQAAPAAKPATTSAPKPAAAAKPVAAPRPAPTAAPTAAPAPAQPSVDGVLQERLGQAVKRVCDYGKAHYGIQVDQAGSGDFAADLLRIVTQLEEAADGIEADALPRLAAVTARLERVLGLTAQASGDPEADHPAVVAFDDLLQGELKAYMDASGQIGGDVKEHSQLVSQAFVALRRLLGIVPFSQKPGPKVLPDLYEAITMTVQEVAGFADAKGGSAQKSHLKAVSEGILAMSWINVEPKPAPFVTEMRDAADFYLVRVAKECPDEGNRAWAQSYKQLLTALAQYVKAHHATGLSWGKKMRSMTFWANAIAQTAPGEGDADRYIYRYKLGAPVAQFWGQARVKNPAEKRAKPAMRHSVVVVAHHISNEKKGSKNRYVCARGSQRERESENVCVCVCVCVKPQTSCVQGGQMDCETVGLAGLGGAGRSHETYAVPQQAPQNAC